MMGGSAAHKLKTEGPDSFFTHTTTLLKQADIAMGNLEGPLGVEGEKFPHKKYNFLVDPSSATGLAHAGFKLLTLANNHTMDFGEEALQSTLAALDAQGLQHCGAGTNDEAARKPAIFEVKGHKVAVLAYSLTYPTEYGVLGLFHPAWLRFRLGARHEGGHHQGPVPGRGYRGGVLPLGAGKTHAFAGLPTHPGPLGH
jgi:poly-gamma-glutamate capsule biosynthesis protein CapA/YwtB (metallophosphatase superfamily)